MTGRRAQAVLLLAAVLLVTGGVAGVRWWTTPDAFGGTGAFESAPLPVDRASITTTVGGPSSAFDGEVVHVDRLEPVFGTGTAAAAATFGLCVPREGAMFIGAVRSTRTECREVLPVEPDQRVVLSPRPDEPYLVVTIEPTRPGRTTLEHVDVTYRRGAAHLWQRGTQRVRVATTVVAR